MSSTRVAMRLSDAERNTARFQDSASPPGLYVPGPAAGVFAPYVNGATNWAWWQVANNVFPMNGPNGYANAPARWYRAGWATTKSSSSMALTANNGFFMPFGVARSALMTALSFYALASASAAGLMWARAYALANTRGSTGFAQVGGGYVTAGATSISAARTIPFNPPIPLVGGHPYLLGLGPDSAGTWTINQLGADAAPRLLPQVFSVSNSSASFYPAAYAGFNVLAASGGTISSGQPIYQSSASSATAQQYIPLIFVQLKTV